MRSGARQVLIPKRVYSGQLPIMPVSKGTRPSNHGCKLRAGRNESRPTVWYARRRSGCAAAQHVRQPAGGPIERSLRSYRRHRTP